MKPNAKPAFSLPEKGEIFIDQVLERCKSLNAAKIWEELSPLRLDTWMRNFKTSLDRYFAACVLDALIYRSRKQTIALMEHLFQRSLVDLTRSSPPPQSPPEWLDIMVAGSRRDDPKVRIVPVLRSDDPPTKSGPLIARLYRRHLGFNERWMIWPWQIKDMKADGIRTFIFIDDFLGTSSQFREFAIQFDLAKELSDVYSVYAPLVAHRRGLDLLGVHMPFMRVCSAEIIDTSHSLFSQGSRHFADGVNDASSALRYYDTFLQGRDLRISRKFRWGYGRLALAYSFEHATPNNCLPLLWVQAANWEPLFER